MLSLLLRGKRRNGSDRGPGLPEKRPPPLPAARPAPPRSDDGAELARIARAAVQLAAVGPRLASLAGDMEARARAQAERARTMAGTMDGLARDLEGAVGALRASSGQMQEAVATVDRVADHTRLLSINASIEAARAGAEGRAFAVVVDEVKQLADRTGQTTVLIEERMREIRDGIARVAAVASSGDTSSADRAALTVGAVNREVRGMADSAGQQIGGAESLHAMSDQARQLTEALLMAVGRFRFDAHARAQDAVEGLLPSLAAHWGDRAATELALEHWLGAHPSFELAYLTDARGRQTVDNLRRQEGAIAHDPAGFGRDWTARPWYRDAVARSGLGSTDFYRSTATGDFCFTVSVALRDRRGALLGVFGSDVNFQKLVAE